MIECPLRGFYGTYKPRSRVGLGKGSHSTSQRLVEALAEPCAKTKRTYGLCTSKGKAHVQGVAGKLTDDKEMSASRLPGLMGYSKYSTPNDELQFSINAIKELERPDIGNEAMGWGNTLEPVILTEAAKRLGLTKFDVEINQAFTHSSCKLSCSLDGIGYGDNQEIMHDPSNGIYVVGQDSIKLDGAGVLEAKLTKTIPEETPHLARGPIQLQGQMLVTGHKWGAVCVLYQGIELRVFLFAPHHDTQKAILKAVLEFEHKLQTFRDTGATDWYPPESSKEVDNIYPYAKKSRDRAR